MERNGAAAGRRAGAVDRRGVATVAAMPHGERAGASGLATRFPPALRDSGLIAPGDIVVVALSGGLDSVVLLHLLRFLLGSWRLRLVAAHFDHRMRDGSGADAAWVRGLCRAWRVPLACGAADRPLRGEADARDARYAFLHDVAARHGARRIATGHHADDQAETVLFRILRGTGARGLAGIPARRGAIVRPLLDFRRAELRDYARTARIPHREDPTNRDPRLARNRLRHRILPRIETVAPGTTAALIRLAERARVAEDAWDAALDAIEPEVVLAAREGSIELARPVLLSYHLHIRTRLIRRILRRLGSMPGNAGTSAAVEFTSSGRSGARIDVAGRIRIEREFDRIRFRRVTLQAEPIENRPVLIRAGGEGAGVAVVGGRRFDVRWAITREDPTRDSVAFPLAALRFPLVVRSWAPGDRIRLPYGTKKLKKLFHERRVGRAERSRIPILADADGRLLWVTGVARTPVASPRAGDPLLHLTVTDAEAA